MVGDRLGLTFNPLSKEDPQATIYQKVNKLAFDSHIFYRLISFVPNWWRNLQEAFLGFSKDKKSPLALIPQRGEYHAIDLENRSQSPMSQAVESELAKHGFEFFRRFAQKDMLLGKDLLQFALFRKVGILFTVLGLSFLIALLNLFFPFFNQILFDVVVPIGDRSLLVQIFIGMVLINLCNEIFIYSREFIILKFEQKVEREFEAAMWQRLLDLPLGFFRKTQIGDLLIRIFSISDIRRTLSGQATRVIINSIFSLIYLIPMLYYSLGLSLVALVTLFIGIAISAWAVVKNVTYYRRLLELKGKMNDQMLELLSGISKIRIFGAEKLVFVLWEKIFYPMKRIEWFIQIVNNIAHVINFALSTLSTLVIFAAYILFIQKLHLWHSLTVGQFLAFLAAFGPFSLAIVSLSNIVLDSIRLVPTWEKSQTLFKVKPETVLSKITLEQLSGNLALDHVNFRYDENSPYVLEDIDMDFKEGEFIGIIGPSGSGKSTLLRLLLGFEFPESGAIYYDNKDLVTLDLPHVRKQLGVVLQTSTLIDGTIQENISVSSFYNEEQILRAL